MTHQKTANLYLYLALVCFAGILAIFVVDGYLGIYDTVFVAAQEGKHKIEPDYWQQPWVEEQSYRMGTLWGETSYFKYVIENRTFSVYEANIEVSVWKRGEKIKQLLDEDISVAPFKDVAVNWRLKVEDLDETELEMGSYREYTVRVRLNGIDRKIIMSYHREVPAYPPVPAPIR